MNAQHVRGVSQRSVVYEDMSKLVLLLTFVDVNKALSLMNKWDEIGHLPLCVYVYYEFDNYYIYCSKLDYQVKNNFHKSITDTSTNLILIHSRNYLT
jgi:hypothetical protein